MPALGQLWGYTIHHMPIILSTVLILIFFKCQHRLNGPIKRHLKKMIYGTPQLIAAYLGSHLGVTINRAIFDRFNILLKSHHM